MDEGHLEGNNWDDIMLRTPVVSGHAAELRPGHTGHMLGHTGWTSDNL